MDSWAWKIWCLHNLWIRASSYRCYPLQTESHARQYCCWTEEMPSECESYFCSIQRSVLAFSLQKQRIRGSKEQNGVTWRKGKKCALKIPVSELQLPLPAPASSSFCLEGLNMQRDRIARLYVCAWWELLNYGWMFLIMPHINAWTQQRFNPNVSLIYVCSVFALKCTGWHLFVVAPLWHCNSVGLFPPPLFFPKCEDGS